MTVFPMTSRYHAIPTASLVTAGGATIVYLTRRLLPPPERFHTLVEHVVIATERLDTITASYVGDPERFWQVCDANNAMRPEDLTVVGRRLRITLPEGIPGTTSA